MIKEDSPSPPSPIEPDTGWEHHGLWRSVKDAIYTLPSRFQSDLVISGVLATDLYAFNSSLGATIEEQVVQSLNRLRSPWDPDDRYAQYNFERRPQTFPDVVLQASAPRIAPEIIMGIELKGWYVLAKEREPSFRYKVTPAVCAPADLLVVVPWALSNVISGSPRIFKPFVLGAKYAAEYRNWYWEHAKGGAGDNSIAVSSVATHYPTKSDMISDRPASDSGGNFGRVARTRIMDDYRKELFADKLAGIPLEHWIRFLALFTENNAEEAVARGLERLARAITAGDRKLSDADRASVKRKLQELAALIS